MTEELQSVRLPAELVRRLQKRIYKTDWWVDGPKRASRTRKVPRGFCSLCLSLPDGAHSRYIQRSVQGGREGAHQRFMKDSLFLFFLFFSSKISNSFQEEINAHQLSSAGGDIL